MTLTPACAAPSIGALAWRQTLRDFRAGELRLLALAVMLAVAALTAVGFFADRLNQGLARDARQLLGGDAVVGSDKPAPPELLQRATRAGPADGHQRQFPEHGPRARRHGRRLAAGGGQGRQRRLPAARPAAPEARRPTAPSATWPARPARGTVWVDAALLDALQLKVGDDAAARRRGAADRPASSSSSPTAAPAS